MDIAFNIVYIKHTLDTAFIVNIKHALVIW